MARAGRADVLARILRTMCSVDDVTARDDRVPALGLGTWRLTGERAERAVTDALEMGYRHIDTAHQYGNEEEIGRALRSSGVERSQVFLTTKQWLDRLSRDEVREGAEASLRRLGTDYVDVSIGRRHGKSASQVTLRWLVQHDIVAAIPKASSREHLRENLDIFDFELSADEMARITGLAREERLIDPDFAPAWRT
jgi:diketogulonate reductase-like aldo/keto reductase